MGKEAGKLKAKPYKAISQQISPGKRLILIMVNTILQMESSETDFKII